MESKQEKSMSIVMVPYLAHGHVSPFYELAKKLSNKGFHIYFCSTPICLEPIRNNNNHFDHQIKLIDLQLPSSFHQQLPPHYHSTKNLPPHLMNTLLAAFDASKPAFSDILKTLRPELVIYDGFQPWAAEAARELNIEAVLFITGVQSQKIPKSSTEIQAKFGKPEDVFGDVVPVGPLVQRPLDHDGDEKIMDWLNKKEASSVVFVSFGSENFLSQEEIEEMAHGLELSNVDFIWVVRFHAIPLQFDQPLNANLAVDIGVAIEVPARREKKITRQEVTKAIKTVVVEEQGKEVRRRAKEWSENWKKKEDEEFNVAVEKLLQLVQQSKK
ncbi:hypothetical protein LWI29_036532 [Acer saccharum]|uniref:Glycosyltransferase N-terminal domain-containing protein n=1 Tax=Acer saccharum TaxID=4024 RepID=A0AA39VYA5_ACESA|nr:hypothetical protein LWI29_036532 [Acer saccharum]